MQRWKNYGSKDTQLQIDGDPRFKGVDMLHDRSLLDAGMLAASENKRLRDGPAATRLGTTMPDDFNPNFTNVINGSGVYSNPNGDDVILVSEQNKNFVWQLQFGKDPKQIHLSGTSTTGNGWVQFVQAFDKVVLLTLPQNGSQPQLIWDGFPAGTGHTGTFDPMVLSSEGLNLVPFTWWGEPHENRVMYYYAYGGPPWNTQFIMSDVLDPTSYDNVYGVMTIAAAGHDHIVRLLGYQKGALLCCMRRSIMMMENFTVDPNQTTQRYISHVIGTAGVYMPLMVGAEIFVLSEPGGFYKITQVLQDQITYEPIPISRPIQPIIDRINWPRQHEWGSSASLGDYAYFCVALDSLDGAADSILVFNTATNQWESAPDWWDDTNFRINRLHVTIYDQARRLFAMDYSAQKIYLLGEGITDHINGNTLQINDKIESRGYICGDPGGFKRFERLVLSIRTSNPNVTVTAIGDGVGEEIELASFTKDPTISYVHGRGPTTVDPTAPKLEDYNLGSGAFFVSQDFESLPIGDISILPQVSALLTVGEKQQSLERFPIRQISRWCSIRVENNSGQCDIVGIGVEGIPIEETIKVIA